MSLEVMKTPVDTNINMCKDTLANDDDFVQKSEIIEYNEHSWPAEDPTLYTFKGKKRNFIRAVESLKILMTKGNVKVLGNVTFKVLDSRKKGHGFEYDIEISKDNDRGQAYLKLFGPNSKKEFTIMCSKAKKQDVLFVEVLAYDVIKKLLSSYSIDDAWKNFQEVNKTKSDICKNCNKVFVSERNLKIHIGKYHGDSISCSCKKCEQCTVNNTDLNVHMIDIHENNLVDMMDIGDDIGGTEDKKELDNKMELSEEMGCKESNKRNRTAFDSNTPCSSPPTKKVQILNSPEAPATDEENIQVPNSSDDPAEVLKTKLLNLETENLRLLTENDNIKKFYDGLKKEVGLNKKELKLLKEENAKMNLEIGTLQYDKDKLEAVYKAENKIKKVKENTKLFNKIIEKQLEDGDIVNIDISKYKEKEMEECDGGQYSSETTGYGNIQNLINNKNSGGRRTNPQQNSEQRMAKFFKCGNCEFISQNKIFFNEHMTKQHTGQQNGANDFNIPNPIYHNVHENRTERKKMPCRFFNNGNGRCTPRTGTCNYDHRIIPNEECELCFHKETCTYKPYCIFFHPEGQDKENWEQSKRKIARVCRFAANGETCMRSVCDFYHPKTNIGSVFHMEQIRKPPIQTRTVPMISRNILPVRVPVIVRRNKPTNPGVDSMKMSLKEMSLD